MRTSSCRRRGRFSSPTLTTMVCWTFSCTRPRPRPGRARSVATAKADSVRSIALLFEPYTFQTPLSSNSYASVVRAQVTIPLKCSTPTPPPWTRPCPPAFATAGRTTTPCKRRCRRPARRFRRPRPARRRRNRPFPARRRRRRSPPSPYAPANFLNTTTSLHCAIADAMIRAHALLLWQSH